jgi:hypothetical protein
VTRCHICKQPCVREFEPPFGEVPAVTEPDVWTVAIRNGLYVDACFSCWFLWPDKHKLWPEIGYGREVVDVLRETAA